MRPAAAQGDADVLVVIVNYRTGALVVDCLRSLEQERALLPRMHVAVVDNASGDDSLERIASAITSSGWEAWTRVLALPENRGFAAGNNAAVREALAAETPPRYVLLLNPDTTVRPGAVGELVRFLDAHPAVGIAGSRLEDPDGTVQASCFRFYGILGEIDNGLRIGLISRLLKNHVARPPHLATAHRVDWVSGAAMMVRREVFADIGLMDEGYFLYYEESDFCLRSAKRGYECWRVPESRVVHLIGKSTGVTGAAERTRRRPLYWFRSRRRYFIKNHGRLYQVAVDCAWLASFLLWRARRFVQRKPDVDPPHLAWDFLRYSLLGL